MLVAIRRRMIVKNWRCSICRHAAVLFITLGFAVCCMSPDACAGGVHFGFGIDVPSPGYVVAPPEVYPPPVMVQRMPPPPVMVQRMPPPPPVVVEPAPPVVVYDEPVVVERRSSVYYYYRPSYRYHSYHVETGRTYYRHRSDDWEDDDEY